MKPAHGKRRTGGHDPVDLTDVTDGEQLIRYAVNAQIARFDDLTHASVATAIKMDKGNFSRAVGRGTAKLSIDQIRQLDEVLVAADLELRNTGGLTTFAARLRGQHDRSSLSVQIPLNWARDVLLTPTTDEVVALIQGSSIVSMFLAADRAGISSGRVRSSLDREIRDVVGRLVVVGGAPPTSKNIEAQVLLGSLAKYAFEVTWARLEQDLRYHPLGFRAWRSITKLVRLASSDEDLEMNLRPRLRLLLSESPSLRNRSIYPGRSLDLETAISVPQTWSRPEDDWVAELLLMRARESTATVRERGTAAHGYWERACRSQGPTSPAIDTVAAIIELLRTDTTRPEVVPGLQWAAATLDRVVENRSPACNTWPETDAPWFQVVAAAAGELEASPLLPRTIAAATRVLFSHVMLQNAGVHRRSALDTLVAGGWTEPVSYALAQVLNHDELDSWVRIRALFALGFLQHRSDYTQQTLTQAARTALRHVTPNSHRIADAQITEAHAALFALGDLFGVKGAEAHAARARDELVPTLNELVAAGIVDDPAYRRLARAMVYFLTFSAQEPGDFSHYMLKMMAESKDDVTQSFSNWALGFRFGSGGIQPILASTLPGIASPPKSNDQNLWRAFGGVT